MENEDIEIEETGTETPETTGEPGQDTTKAPEIDYEEIIAKTAAEVREELKREFKPEPEEEERETLTWDNLNNPEELKNTAVIESAKAQISIQRGITKLENDIMNLCPSKSEEVRSEVREAVLTLAESNPFGLNHINPEGVASLVMGKMVLKGKYNPSVKGNSTEPVGSAVVDDGLTELGRAEVESAMRAFGFTRDEAVALYKKDKQ